MSKHNTEDCEYCKLEVQEPEIAEIVEQTSCTCTSGLNVENFKYKCDVIHFYTSLESYEKLMFVYETLDPAAARLKYVYGHKPPNHISPVNRFFWTLIRLREHKMHFESSILFKTTIKHVDNIFLTWIHFMRLE